jgi:DNA replication and repair protein RecF
VRFGTDGFGVRAGGTGDAGPVTLEVAFRAGEGKQAKINGTAVTSLDRVRMAASTLVFTPDRLAVVKAGPAVRRAYVDRVTQRLHPARAALAGEYAEALAQRNAALRRVAAGAAPLDTVEPWSERLVEAAGALSGARTTVIEELLPRFAGAAGELGLAEAGIAYIPSPISADVLARRLAADLERGLTGAGPHHDEVRFTAGDRELRTHGSQGEQRVTVLALLLAEAELLGDRRGVPPLLLLDDVLSELDGDRRAALVARIRGGSQVLVTAAAAGALPGQPDQLLEVAPGRVRVA